MSFCCCSCCLWPWPCGSHHSEDPKTSIDQPLLAPQDVITKDTTDLAPNLHETDDSESASPQQNDTYIAQYECIGVKKGDVLKTIEKTENPDTKEQQWKLFRNVSTGSVIKAPVVYLAKVTDIHDEPWYFSELQNRADAESMLQLADEEDGLFLVRKGPSETIPFVLSVKSLVVPETNTFKVTHYRIFMRDNVYGGKENEQFVTVSKMIESYLNDTPPMLIKPCPKTRGVEINRNELDIQSEIERGQFGVVKNGVWRNHKVAIKELILSSTTTQDDFMKEIQLMKQFEHHNIVSLYGVCTDSTPYVMVMEFMENGSLLAYIKNNELNLTQDIQIIQQIAEGMEFLERYKVIHRDLAARNILLASDLTAKIADFGLSRKLHQENYYVMTSHTKVPILWMAVESITTCRYTSKSDVWSFGILIMEIFTRGSKPYSEYSMKVRELCPQIEHGLRMTKPPDMPDDIYAKIASCWLHNPNGRPTFREVNKFFSSHKF